MTSPGGREIGRISIRVLPDTSKFRADLRIALERIERRAQLNVSVELDTNTLAARARAATKAAERAAGPIVVRVDSRPFLDTAAKLQRVGRRLSNVFTGAVSAATRLFTLVLAGTVLNALVVTAGAAIVNILALTGSLGQLSGVLALLPAAGLAAAAGIAAVAIGVQGFGTAVTETDPTKLAEALANLSPNARAAAVAVRQLRPALSQLRREVQDRLFAGLARDIAAVARVQLPVLRRGLAGIAAQANAATRQFAGFLTLPATVRDTATSLSFTQRAFRALVPAVRPASQAILDLGVVGSSFLPRLAAAVTDLAERFATFIAQTRQSGQLAEFIEDGLTAVRQLGQVAAATGRILAGLFRAAQAAGGTTLASLADTLQGVADTINSAPVQAGLTAVFAAFLSIAHQLAAALPPLGAALAALGPTLQALSSAASTTLVTVLTELARVISTEQVQGGLTEIVTGLLAGLRALLPALPPLADAFAALAPAAADLARFAGTAVASALTSMANAAQTVAPLLRALAGFLADNASAIGTLAPLLLVAGVGLRTVGFGIRRVQNAKNAIDVLKRFTGGLRSASVAASATSGAAGTLGGILRTAGIAVVTFARAVGVMTLALVTNPIFLVIAGLTALGVAIFLLLRHFDGLRNAVLGVFSAIGDAALAVLGFLKDNWAPVVGLLLGGPIGAALGFLVKLVIGNFGQIKKTLTGAASDIAGFALRVARFFTGLATAAQVGIDLVIAFVRGLPRRALAALGNLGVLLLQAGRNLLVGPGLLGGVTSMLGRLLGFFLNLHVVIIRALGNVGRILFDSGKRLIQGFVDGIKAMVGAVKDAVGNVLSGARDLLPFSPAREGPFSGRGWTLYSGRSLIEGLVDGLESRYRQAIASLTRFTDTLSTALTPPAPVTGFAPVSASTLTPATAPASPGVVALHPDDRRLLTAVAERPVALQMDGRELGRAVRTQQLREQRR